MTVNSYRLGSQVTLTGRFYADAAKTILADPTTAVLTIRDPTGAILTPTVVNAGVGIRTYAWTPALRGMHDIRWVGTGAVVSADQESVFVLEDFTLGVDLTTVANVRAAVGITGTSSDALIQDLITSASMTITNRYQREFAAVSGPPTRRFKVKNLRVALEPYDLRAATTVTLHPEATSHDTLTASKNYALQPVGTSSLGTYTELMLSNNLMVTSTTLLNFGYALLDIT